MVSAKVICSFMGFSLLESFSVFFWRGGGWYPIPPRIRPANLLATGPSNRSRDLQLCSIEWQGSVGNGGSTNTTIPFASNSVMSAAPTIRGLGFF